MVSPEDYLQILEHFVSMGLLESFVHTLCGLIKKQ